MNKQQSIEFICGLRRGSPIWGITLPLLFRQCVIVHAANPFGNEQVDLLISVDIFTIRCHC